MNAASRLDRPLATYLCALAVSAALLLHSRFADPDLFARIAVGRMFELLGHMPTIDPFSFPPGRSWIDHEWLSGVVFWKIANLAGDAGLILFRWGALAVFLALLLAARTLRCGVPAGSGALFVALSLPCYYLFLSIVRAQVFTYVLLPLVFLCLESGRRAPLLLLPPIFMLWANLHGGVALGLAFFGLFVCCRAIERRLTGALALSFAISIAATLANPYGFHYWEYLIRALSMPRPSIGEWRAVAPSTPVGAMIAVLTMTYLLGCLVHTESRSELFPRAGVIVAAIGGFAHLRLAGVFFILLCIYGQRELLAAAGQIAPVRVRAACRDGLAVAVFLLSLVFPVMFSVSPVRHLALDYSNFPVNAADWLRRSGTSGRLLVGFNEGSFAIWALYPIFRVSLDGRYEELYTEETLNEVRCALDASCPEQGRLLTAMNPDAVLARAGRFDAGGEAGASYRRAYHDARFEVFVRHDALLVAPFGSDPEPAAVWDRVFQMERDVRHD